MLKKKKQLFPNMNTFRAANSRRVLIENIGQTWNIFELLSVLKLWIKNLYFDISTRVNIFRVLLNFSECRNGEGNKRNALNVPPYAGYAKSSNKRFIFPQLFHFLVFWHLVFEKHPTALLSIIPIAPGVRERRK